MLLDQAGSISRATYVSLNENAAYRALRVCSNPLDKERDHINFCLQYREQ
jgi:hypothetical protein